MVVGDGGATRGGTFNGWKNLHNTRLTYTPPPPSIQISPVNRLCARQTPKLRTGRTLSMAPVAIFFVRDAQMHRAFDNWSGTNDISFARCVAYAFYKLSDCQTVADSKGHCYKSRNYRDRVTQSLYIYIYGLEIYRRNQEVRLPRLSGNFYLISPITPLRLHDKNWKKGSQPL